MSPPRAIHSSTREACPQAAAGTKSTFRVGTKTPNAFGLYDMHGNVMEWCLDSYDRYTSAAVTDPFATGRPEHVLHVT